MDLYREEVMEHYEHPRHQGEMQDPDYEGRDSNASCGDMIQIQIRITSNNSKVKGKVEKVISEVKWKGIGCAISNAAASKLSEWLIGKKWETVKKMSEEQLVKEGIGFTVNPGRVKCLTLPVRVVKKLLS